MTPARKTLLSGSVTFVVGLALWLFGTDEQILGIAPSKGGVGLMFIGGLETLYGVYKGLRGDDEAHDS